MMSPSSPSVSLITHFQYFQSDPVQDLIGGKEVCTTALLVGPGGIFCGPNAPPVEFHEEPALLLVPSSPAIVFQLLSQKYY